MKAAQTDCRKYFCVSTDKAANPVNMMGASKRIMEMFLMRASLAIPVSTARFANVAFSDGSLLHGFNQRMQKQQPLSVPRDVKRYFLTPKESGELCLLSCLLGQNRDIFFPKLSEGLSLTTFPEIAIRYLEEMGYEADVCSSEAEARAKTEDGATGGKWPCYFFDSDTTGEKDFEEFFVEGEKLDMERFEGIGVIKNDAEFDQDKLQFFLQEIAGMKEQGRWTKLDLIRLFQEMLVNFQHKETGKYLNDKM
jgi:FlaA1/EpsC-like NDP-sugar epimerase